MKARKLLEEAPFRPDVMRVICEAFDAAWGEIATRYKDPAQMEAVRLRMVKALLAAAKTFSDFATLKQLALAAAERTH